ncbi:MAG: DEAD/DEAH box helicase [Promethearchaeota archaeon]
MSETLNADIMNSSEIEYRKYQSEIAKHCVNKNSLVVLPTGLGKTIIAVLVAAKTLELFPTNSKIIILAPTRPLINQHYDTFLKMLSIPRDQYYVLTGKVAPEKRAQLFHENSILFYTPQTLRNDLVSKKYKLDTTSLIIFDEAHHASGEYAYTLIADEYRDQNPDGTILALTASPGSSKEKINKLCKNLYIPVDNIHIRTRKDKDVMTYLKPMDIYKIGVNLNFLMEEIYQSITYILEERLKYLSQLSFLEGKSEPFYNKVIRKDLLKLNNELVKIVRGNGDKTGAYSALSINAQALILYHMLELVEQQGLDVLLSYLEKLNSDAKKKTSSKAIKILVSDQRVRNIFLELKKNKEFSPEYLEHPKYPVLVKVIKEELTNNPRSRILVFVKLRESIKKIVEKLNSEQNIIPIRFVGQATKSSDDKGLSQNRQIEILDEFKQGIYNVLVSTNVGEEGLDIAECDLVVFYDVVASEIRLIQRKGRTARHREGKVIILYCKGTHDEIYLAIALRKLKKMNIHLKNPHYLKESYSHNIVQKEAIEVKSIREGQQRPKSKIKVKDNIQKKVYKKQYQSNLQTFLKISKSEPLEEELLIQADIKISKYFPMKFGLRKKLQEDNIIFNIVDSDLHIVIFNKVLIQIYDPKETSKEGIVTEINELREICSLLILVFDFTNFKEGIEGERWILKRKVQELGKEHDLHIINVDNSEELYFIVKGILENQQKEVSENE